MNIDLAMILLFYLSNDLHFINIAQKEFKNQHLCILFMQLDFNSYIEFRTLYILIN